MAGVCFCCPGSSSRRFHCPEGKHEGPQSHLSCRTMLSEDGHNAPSPRSSCYYFPSPCQYVVSIRSAGTTHFLPQPSLPSDLRFFSLRRLLSESNLTHYVFYLPNCHGWWLVELCHVSSPVLRGHTHAPQSFLGLGW